MTTVKKSEDPVSLANEIVRSTLVSATLSVPKNNDPAGAKKIRLRAITLKSGPHWQIEEFRGRQSFHRNVMESELESLVASWLSGEWGRSEFVTTTTRYSVMTNRRGELAVLRKANNVDKAKEHNSIFDQTQPTGGCAQPGHDRAKQYILADGIPVPFLIDLGVMTPEGKVVKSHYDKFRQINRFLEFIEDILPEFDEEAGTTRDLVVIDFGCGKSYLTFAVYYYLSVIKKLRVRITGLDLKTEVIERCVSLADSYGYRNLSFIVGDIASYTGTDQSDLVISLHACDTATDFALSRAIQWNTRVILAVPCCQHEINTQLGKAPANPAQPGTDNVSVRTILEPAFKYGILRERFASLLTDAIRAELLEKAGYKVQILEFIDMTHTPKNLLIRAVRKLGEIDTEPGLHTRLGAAFGVAPTLETELGTWKKSL